MEKTAIIKISEEHINKLLSLSHIELKILIYFMLVQTNSIIYLTTAKRLILCDNLTITSQKLSTTLSSLLLKNIIRKIEIKQYQINLPIIFADSYYEAVEKIYKENYFKDECSI